MTLSRATQLLDQESVGIQKIDKDHLFVTNIMSFVVCVRQKELFKVAPAPFPLSTWGSTTPSVAV